MLQSMTAFARHTASGTWGSATWELRSLNSRYFDMYFKMPEDFKRLEVSLRERAVQCLSRGKLECALTFKPVLTRSGEPILNRILLEPLLKACQEISKLAGETALPLRSTDLLSFPGVLEIPPPNFESSEKELLALFELSLKALVKMRTDEGSAIKKLLETRLHKMTEIIKQARLLQPTALKRQREKILKRFEECRLDLDLARLEQELLFLAQKTDVAEELDRLDLHIIETQKTLKEGGVVGRRLDFLMQELNREANTLASKALDPKLTFLSVDLKVLVDEMREQIQNLE